ncbi:MAG: hypothetical protein ACXWVP_05345 [Burkholderiales bacterium]
MHCVTPSARYFLTSSTPHASCSIHSSRASWSDPNRQNAEVECFLEGPAFDRQGNLYVVDFTSNGDLYFTDQGQTGIADPTGRLFRLRADGCLERLVKTFRARTA